MLKNTKWKTFHANCLGSQGKLFFRGGQRENREFRATAAGRGRGLICHCVNPFSSMTVQILCEHTFLIQSLFGLCLLQSLNIKV
jgi:hypothetical protein